LITSSFSFTLFFEIAYIFKQIAIKLQYFSLCHDGLLSDRKVRKNFAVGKFTRHINRVTSFNIKVCNLTSCCGLQVQNPIQAIKLFIGPGNTFHFNQKWARTLPVSTLQELFRERCQIAHLDIEGCDSINMSCKFHNGKVLPHFSIW
jgi:hypothetical protein